MQNRIYTINNKKEESLLRSKLKDFDFQKFSKAQIRELIKDMRKAMKEAKGVGLAANQIGLNLRVFIAEHDGKFYSIFNPKIAKTFGEREPVEEGCLSVPGKYGLIGRYDRVVLEAFDRSGKKIKIKAWGLLAQIFQHETDHLDGKLYIDSAKDIRDVPKTEE